MGGIYFMTILTDVISSGEAVPSNANQAATQQSQVGPVGLSVKNSYASHNHSGVLHDVSVRGTTSFVAGALHSH
jgi:hypothetical protein